MIDIIMLGRIRFVELCYIIPLSPLFPKGESKFLSFVKGDKEGFELNEKNHNPSGL